jgi:phosphotransferase system HPr-like phosphotransfer protein
MIAALREPEGITTRPSPKIKHACAIWQIGMQDVAGEKKFYASIIITLQTLPLSHSQAIVISAKFFPS